MILSIIRSRQVPCGIARRTLCCMRTWYILVSKGCSAGRSSFECKLCFGIGLRLKVVVSWMTSVRLALLRFSA